MAANDSMRSVGRMIPAEDVAECMIRDGISLETFMLGLLPSAAALARTPVSGFGVGAVVEGTPSSEAVGNLYLGANLEIGGAALAATVHAEQAAVNNAWLHGETAVRSIAVTAAPCGHCRQFLYELTTAADLEILIAANGSGPNGPYTKHSLAELLPAAFGPQDLEVDDRLMSPAAQRLDVLSADPLAQQALAAANASYATYSKNFAGVALELADGRSVCGRVAENAAFNPTLGPLMSALSQLALDGGDVPFDIIDAVLVEVPTTVSQRSFTEAILMTIAPAAALRYVVATADRTRAYPRSP